MITDLQGLLAKTGRMFRLSTIQHVGALTLSQYIASGLGILMTVIAARILGPERYGQAALILAFPSLLRSFGSFKSVNISTRYLAGFRATGKVERLRAIAKLGYLIDFSAFACVFLIVLLIGWLIAQYFYEAPWMFPLMALYAASFPFLSFRGTSFAILTAFEEFRWLSILHILGKGISLFSVLVLLLAGYRVAGMVLGMALGNVLIGMVSLSIATSFLIRNRIGSWWRGSLKNIAYLKRELISFFGWNYLIVTLDGALAQVPVMLLGRIRGPEEAGFFRLALSLMTFSSYPAAAGGRVAYPRFSGRWARGERDSLKASVKRWTLRGGVPLSIVIVLVIPLLPAIVPFVLGEEYRPMVSGVQVLLVATAVRTLFFWLSSYYYATGEVATWAKGFLLYTVLVLVLGWPAIVRWGFFGIAVLFAAAKVLFLLVMAGRVYNKA